MIGEPSPYQHQFRPDDIPNSIYIKNINKVLLDAAMQHGADFCFLVVGRRGELGSSMAGSADKEKVINLINKLLGL